MKTSTIVLGVAAVVGVWAAVRYKGARDMNVDPGFALLKYPFTSMHDIYRMQMEERMYGECMARTNGQGPCSPRFTIQPLFG